jgi:2-methylfumaryl-CoA isomerase
MKSFRLSTLIITLPCSLAACSGPDSGSSGGEDSLPAPVIGEHTDQILADVLKLGSHQIGRLHDEGVVA